MRILHYIIGIPPYRHGGAPRYALDLAIEQSKTNKIILLFPGNTLRIGNKAFFKKVTNSKEIECYSIENPDISPLLFGLKDAGSIIDKKKEISEDNLNYFHELTKPDIVHLHTLMGIPDILLKFWKTKNVKIILTSHDYYGICPKVNMFDYMGNICSGPSAKKCAICNYTSKSYLFLTLCNSTFFLKYKHLLPFKSTHFKNENKPNEEKYLDYKPNEKIIKKFSQLIDYYKNYFSYINFIHFNSEIAKSVYNEHCLVQNSTIEPITTSKIKDNRIVKKINKNQLIFGFIGSISDYKGFPMLKTILNNLYNQGIKNFVLNVWEDGLEGIDKKYPFIIYKGKYTQNQTKDVYTSIDLLIVPSIWYETFSLVTLEALSYGTPVLVSNHVGAKDIIKKYDNNFIFSNKEDLEEKIKNLLFDASGLEKFNNEILNNTWEHSIDNHCSRVVNIYKQLIKK